MLYLERFCLVCGCYLFAVFSLGLLLVTVGHRSSCWALVCLLFSVCLFFGIIFICFCCLPLIQCNRTVVEFLNLAFLAFTHVATHIGRLGYIHYCFTSVRYIIFYVTNTSVYIILPHRVISIRMDVLLQLLYPVQLHLSAISHTRVDGWALLLYFASTRRWISGERVNKSQSLSFAETRRLRRSSCSRLDAAFRHWNSKVRSRRHTDRCYATDTEVCSLNDRDDFACDNTSDDIWHFRQSAFTNRCLEKVNIQSHMHSLRISLLSAVCKF